MSSEFTKLAKVKTKNIITYTYNRGYTGIETFR